MWVKLDDDFYLHPKLVLAGPVALAMQVASLCYSNHYKTRGFIPYSVADRLLDLRSLASIDTLTNVDDLHVSGWRIVAGEIAETLVHAGIWHEDTERGGWHIHDYGKYQPESVAEERHEAKVRAGRAGGLAKAGKGLAPLAKASPIPVPDPVATNVAPDPEPEPKDLPPNPPLARGEAAASRARSGSRRRRDVIALEKERAQNGQSKYTDGKYGSQLKARAG